MKSRTKKRLIALGLVLALGAGGALGLRQFRAMRRAQGIVEARTRGMSAYDVGDWAGAMEGLSYFVGKSRQRDAEALYRLADARQRVPKPDNSQITEAIAYARDAEVGDPSRQDIRRLLVDLYQRVGMWPEALSTIDKSLAVTPEDRTLLEERIAILANLGRRDEAARASEALARAFPADPAAHRNVLAARFASGAQSNQSVREYLDALPGLMGEGTDLHILRSEALVALDDADGALDDARRALDLGITTPDQLETLLPILDVLATVRPQAADLAPTLVAGIVGRENLSPEMGRVLVARAYRLGTPAGVAQAMKTALADPEHASDGALGWAALTAGTDPATDVARVRAVLASRPGAEAAFWNSALTTNDAIRQLSPEAVDPARASLSAAQLLPGRLHNERSLALYLTATAERLAGARDSAEEHLAELARQPGWRVARRDYITLLIDRGEFNTALREIEYTNDPDPGFARTGVGVMLGCEALVSLAEQVAEPSPDATMAVRGLTALTDAGLSTGDILGLLARAHAASGDLSAAAQDVQRMLAMGDDLPITVAVRTASALRPRMPEASQSLLTLAGQRQPNHPELLFQRAMLAVEQGRPDEARTILQSGAQAAQGVQRLQLQRALARLLDVVGDPDARRELTALADANPDSLPVQQELLDSRSAWADETLVKNAIARVRALTGESSPQWRLHEARRLLTFSPDKARASEALTVVLDPVLRAGDTPRAFEMAAKAWLILENRDQAIQSLARAADEGSDPAATYPPLIGLLRAAGRADEARARLLSFVGMGQVGTQVARQRASLLEQFAMWDQAIAQREALAQNQTFEDSIALADLYARTGRVDQAAAIYDRLLETQAPTRRLIISAATFRAQQGDVGGGTALFERLAGVIPESERVLLVGDYLKAAGRSDQARQVVRAFADDPAGGARDPQVWLWLARASFESSDRDAGLDAITRGLAADPEYPPLLALRRLASEGVTDTLLLAAISTDENTDRADPIVREFNDALLAYSQGRLDAPRMQERLASITARHPTFLRAWRVLTRLRLVTGDRDGAARAATDAMRLIPGDPTPARDATEVLAAVGRLDEAMIAAREWRERSPGDTLDPDVAIAGIHLMAGRSPEALAVLREHADAILSSPAPTIVRAGTLTAALAASGPSPQLEQAMSKSGDSLVWARACLGAAPSISDLPRRREWLTRVQRSSTLEDADILDAAKAWRDLGTQTASPADLEASLALLTSRQWNEDLAPVAALDRAMTLRRLGRSDEAREQYLTLARTTPARAIDARTALLVMVLEDTPQAAADVLPDARTLTEQVSADATATPEAKATAFELLAQCHLAAGQASESIAAVDRGLAGSPGNPALILRKVQAQLVLGNRDAAATTIDQLPNRALQADAMLVIAGRLATQRPADTQWLYERLHARDADNFLASNNLAYHLLTHGGEPAQAATLAQQAVDSARLRDGRPEVMGSVFETLGACLLASGDPPRAERAFRDGLRAQPTSAALLLGLADSLDAQGKRADALQALSAIDEAGRATLTGEQLARYETLAAALDR